MGRQFQPGRAIEVIAPKYGSAYRIGGRLVLTAAHLLNEVGSSCRVRSKETFQEVDAVVAWKAPDCDLALLELPDRVAAVEPAVLGRLPEAKAGEKIGFQMYGYPGWAWIQQENDRLAAVGLQVEGTIYLADRVLDGLLGLRIEAPLTSEYPLQRIEHLLGGNAEPFEPHSEWRAMSGAAIVCDGVVVGVQKQHPRVAQPAYLQAEPLWKVYEDEQWRELLDRHGISPEPEIARVDRGEAGRRSHSDRAGYHPNNLRDRGLNRPDFWGREADERALHDLLQGVEAGGLVAVVGMAGVGKSELAIQYGRSQRETYGGGVAWFSAVNFGEELRDWLQSEFCPDRDLRHLPKLTQQIALGWREWQNFCGSRLAIVIIDDVTDYRQQVEPYLPAAMADGLPFRILLTSRARFVSSRPIPTLELQELDPDSAVAMLMRFAGASRIEADRLTAASICQRLAYLPLAIALVGSWLSIDPDRGLNDLVSSLEREGLAAPALEHDREVVGLTAEQGLIAAFAVSWQQAGAKNSEAQQLARVLTLFAPVDIAWDLVGSVVQTYCQLYPRVAMESKPELSVLRHQRGWRRWWQWLWRRIQQWLGKSPDHPLRPPVRRIDDALEARGILLRLNLLQRIDGAKQVYRVHPLLREYFEMQWNGGDQEGWSLAFAEAIGARATTVPKEMSWEQAAAFQDLHLQFPMAQQILQNRAATASDPETLNRYKTEAGNIRGAMFRLSQPVLLEVAFDRARKVHEQAKAAVAQGNIPLSEQKFAETLEAYRRVVEQARATFPPNSLQLAGYLNQLANLFRGLGRYQDGIAPAMEAVAIAESSFRPTKVATYLNTLGVLHHYQGNYIEALPLFERTLGIRERELGGNHPDTAMSLNNLALLYKLMGRYEAALPLYERSLKIREDVLGENHPDTAMSLNNLAALYYSTGRYEAALPLVERALEIREDVLGRNHPDTAMSLNDLALLYYSMERYEAALPLYERSLKIRERELGGNHPDTANSLNNLALLYYSMGRYEVSLPLVERSLGIRERELGGNHPDTANSLNNLAALYSSMGRYGEAERFYIKALVIFTEVLGETHPSTQRVAGDFRTFLQEAMTARREGELSEHSLTQAILSEL